MDAWTVVVRGPTFRPELVPSNPDHRAAMASDTWVVEASMIGRNDEDVGVAVAAAVNLAREYILFDVDIIALATYLLNACLRLKEVVVVDESIAVGPEIDGSSIEVKPVSIDVVVVCGLWEVNSRIREVAEQVVIESYMALREVLSMFSICPSVDIDYEGFSSYISRTLSSSLHMPEREVLTREEISALICNTYPTIVNVCDFKYGATLNGHYDRARPADAADMEVALDVE